MPYQTADGQSAGPESGTTVVTVAATNKIVIHAVHLSVTAGQTASIDVGSTHSFPTHNSLNLVFDGGRVEGLLGEDVTITSTGGASWLVVYSLY